MKVDSENAECQITDEKLSDEEFKKLIPHLDLNQLFLIELENQGFWKNLFETCYVDNKLSSINCAVCSQNVQLSDFKKHIGAESHANALNQVEKLYHPLFTTSRKDFVDMEEENKRLKAIEIAAAVEACLSRKGKERRQTASPAPLFMSIKDLMNVEFQQKKGGKWQKMISARGIATEKGTYHCNLCKKLCMGVIPVNDHLCGIPHRKVQKITFALRSKLNKSVSKYSVLACVFNEHTKQKSKYVPSKKLPSQEGLIGVEYTVRLQKKNGTYSYVCCLCNQNQIIPTEELMEDHLIGFVHRRTYCEKYYPDTTKHFEEMVKSSGVLNRVGMTYIFSKIADGIEKCHSYGKPHTTTYDYFLKNKKKISDLVDGLLHACQDYGPSFSTVAHINDLIALKSNSDGQNSPLTTTTARFTKPEKGKFYLNMKNSSRNNFASGNVEKLDSVSHTLKNEEALDKSGYSHSSTASRSISPHLHYSRKRRQSPFRVVESSDVWRTYRCRISESASDLEQAYLDYRQHPEKHPQYDVEWRMFWKRRKSELHQDGIDHRSYDFQPEWSAYFRQRLEQFFGEQLQDLKIEVRRQLNIPLDAEEDSNLFYNKQSSEQHHKRMMSEKRCTDDLDPLLERSELPIFSQLQASKEHERSNIIGLLRLMTALDDHLGSTGDKILDLLTKALSLEKTYGADSAKLEEKILNANNCRLLKLAQEKLKSQLYADLVEGNKIKSFHRVIKSAEILLNRADTMGWSSVEDTSSIPPPNLQIESLIEVLQEKTKDNYSFSEKKSLPDTLIELIAQKKDSNQFSDQINLSNNTCQSNLGFGGRSTGLSNSADLTDQRNQFYLPSSFSANTSKSNFSAATLNLPNFQAQGNSSGVWNRLGSQTNFMQQSSQGFVNNSREPGHSVANVFGGKNSFGGRTGSNNSHGCGNGSGNNDAYGSRYISGHSNVYHENYLRRNGTDYKQCENL